MVNEKGCGPGPHGSELVMPKASVTLTVKS